MYVCVYKPVKNGKKSLRIGEGYVVGWVIALGPPREIEEKGKGERTPPHTLPDSESLQPCTAVQLGSSAGTQPDFLPGLQSLPFQFPAAAPRLHQVLLVEVVPLWPPQVNLGWWNQELIPHLEEYRPGVEEVSQDPELPRWLLGLWLPVLLTEGLGRRTTSFAVEGHGGVRGEQGGRHPKLEGPLPDPLGFLVLQARGGAMLLEAQAGLHSCPWHWPFGVGSCHDDSFLVRGDP